MTSREARILEHIDLTRDRGLEIGPLHHAIVEKRAGVAIFYVDHADTDTLREKYADDPAVHDVAEVDFVWGDRRLADAVGDAAPFDFVIASHVIEHAPDTIGWLNELTEVLRPGGVISLAIPDKRYCFDARRQVTGVAEVIDGYVNQRRRPTTRQIYDFWAHIAAVDTAAIWNGEPGWTEDEHHLEAFKKCHDALGSTEYHDVHCTTWTPESFLAVVRTVFDLGLLELAFVAFHPTEPGELEFFVTFERLDPSLSPEHRRARQLASVPQSSNEAVSPTGAVTITVSEKEAALIQRKRRLMTAARSIAGRLRPHSSRGTSTTK